MPTLRPDPRAAQRDPAARAVLSRWRALTGGRQTRDKDRATLLACSGGADSTALILALAQPPNAIAHVVHDLRPPDQTHAERDRVAALADALGLPFLEAAVEVRARPGNAEANARRARYRALERLAWEAGCPFVATAHHAADQLETMLMAMLRGSGVRGLAGMPAQRPLGKRSVQLIRPMLRLGRADAERLCSLAGLTWATDPTNADISRLRAALRQGPARELQSMRPRAANRAADLAEHLREAADLLDSLADQLLAQAEQTADAYRWPRATLAGEHPAVIATALRAAYSRLHRGRHGDRLPARSVRAAVESILAEDRSPRRFVWKAVEAVVTAEQVAVQRTET